jgi:arsenate reductase (glutaredoxin)
MSKVKIYHNPRCRKSREGLQFLQNATKEFEVVDYIKHPLSVERIEELLAFMDKKPFDLVRTEEEYYKKELKGKTISDKEWMTILSEHPRLIKRPIVVYGKKAVFAQPPQKINEIL